MGFIKENRRHNIYTSTIYKEKHEKHVKTSHVISILNRKEKSFRNILQLCVYFCHNGGFTNFYFSWGNVKGKRHKQQKKI